MPHEKTVDFLDIDGARLEYQWIGPGPTKEAPTLVFLHEGLGCVGLWKGFPERLAARTGLGALVYSRLGYGRSDPVKKPLSPGYHLTEASAVLPRVLDEAGVTRAILIGHSDGGTIAIVHLGCGRGGRIDGVIVMATHVFNEDITIEGIRAAQVDYETTDIREKLARYHGENVDWAFWSWNQVWLSPEFRDWNVENCLPGITVPILVIQGEDDHYGSVAQVTAIARQVSGPAETLMVPDCGHSPHLEKPEEVLDAMANFIARLKVDT